MTERRIAVFGGTFDPFHNGHLEVARAVVRNFLLEQLLVVPAYTPPHKDPRAISDAYHRYAMAVLATLEEPNVLVSTIELDAPDRPYSFETVERLQRSLGSRNRLFFVVGADSFEDINTWREPARLFSSVDMIVVTRPGHEVNPEHLNERFRSAIVDLRGYEGRMAMGESKNDHHIYLTSIANTDVSSTEIRQRVRDGQSIDDLVTPLVGSYIKKYELYRR